MINELVGDMTDLMEIMILWLEQQGIVPENPGTEIQRKKCGTGIAMIVDGVELHKNLNKTLTQKKAGCVPSVTALAQKIEDGIEEIKNGLRTRITFILNWYTFFSICTMGNN